MSAEATHVLQLYEGSRYLVETVTNFVAEGLRAHHPALIIAREQHRLSIAAALEAAGLRQDGDEIMCLDAEEGLEAIFRDGHIDKHRFLRFVSEPLRRVRRAAPSAPVRVFGELVDLLCERGQADAAHELERYWHELVAVEPLTLLCGYRLDRFASGEHQDSLQSLSRLHHAVRPTEAYGDARLGDRDQLVASLQQRAQVLEAELDNRRRLEGHLRLIAEASAAFGRSLDYETTLANVIELALPGLGDFGFFDLIEESSDTASEPLVRRIARAHANPSRQALLQSTSWVRSTRTDKNLCALSNGRSALHPSIDDAWLQDIALSPDHLRMMRALDFSSMLTVPLVRRSRTVGALTLFCGTGRHHDESDLRIAEELAHRAAVAVENARLYRDLQHSMQRQNVANRRKDEFLAMLGHELRNPLAPLLTALQLMDLRGDDGSQREREVIRRQARHLTRLVDDLLDVSRVAQGKIVLRRQQTELHPIVASAIELASPLFEERQHTLNVVVPRQGLLVDADEERLTQVITNLLTNAAKYTESGGLVCVTAWRDGDVIEVDVRDSGAGIEPELLAGIFEPFVQGERSLDRGLGGLGLGLALVKGLTELHGGIVTAHSEGRGRGSQFRLRLPAAQPATSAPPPSPVVPDGVHTQGRVLIVDDNEDAAFMLAEVMREMGHEVAVAYDGPSALALSPQFSPTIALLDIGLPVMDGYEVARRLRSAYPSIRLIAITGYGQERDRQHSRAAGFDVHLVKPVHIDQLLLAMTSQT